MKSMKAHSITTERNLEKRIDIIGFLMVITPLVSSILLWYWFNFIEVLKEMSLYFSVVIISTILFTSVLATIDSHRLGLKVLINKEKNIHGGNFLKFFIFLLLWLYSYPVYLLRRKKFGSRNLFYPILLSLIIFIFSSVYLYTTLHSKYIEDDAFKRRVINRRLHR